MLQKGYSLEQAQQGLLERFAVGSLVEIPIAVFDQVFEHNDRDQDLRALLVLEDFFHDLDDVLGAQVRVVHDLYDFEHELELELIGLHDLCHVLD